MSFAPHPYATKVAQCILMPMQRACTAALASSVVSNLITSIHVVPCCRASNSGTTPATPKLAVMVHSALSLPGSSGSSDSGSSGSAYYVRAALHSTRHPLQPLQQQKTGPERQQGSCVMWPNALLQLDPHGEVDDLEVELTLKRKGRLTGGAGVLHSTTAAVGVPYAAGH
jgi:hypothetical protein